MVEKENSAERFWSAYGERNFVSLKRQPNGNCDGVMLDFGEDGEAFFGEQVSFSITQQELMDYPYKKDDRFAPCVFEALESALLAVLRDPGLAEPTEPNRNRLQLVIRLIRDPSTDETSYSVMVQTRDFVKQYADGKLKKDALIRKLRNLEKGRDENFERLCHCVLEVLDLGALSADEAASLLCSNIPLSDNQHVLVWHVVLETISGCRLSVEKACLFLETLLPTEADYAELVESGWISSVKTERDVLVKALSMCPTDKRIANQCMKILDNHENEDFFMIFEAISALGLHNEKACIPFLIKCLARDDMVRYRDGIEEALQMLCSGATLIPKAIWGIDLSEYMEEAPEDEASEEELLPKEVLEILGTQEEQSLKIEYEYWQKQGKTLPDTPDAWSGHDAGSVFWEKRLRCALAAKEAMGSAFTSSFQSDEVLTVRTAAGGSEI